MTRVELDDATGSLSDYTRRARKGPVVVMRGGKPLALLRILSEDEWEDYIVAASPEFRRILKRSAANYKVQGGIPLESIERELGLPPRPKKASRARRRAR